MDAGRVQADVDTTAAIAGGIVATYIGTGNRRGTNGMPLAWIKVREVTYAARRRC